MDKNSLSEWGWIVIIIIILSILIAFATPFGKFIVTSIQNTVDHFYQTTQDAFDAVIPLKQPKNLNVKNEVLSFDPVAGATGYTIKVGNRESFSVDSTTVGISDELIGVEGEVVIFVNAFDDKKASPKAEYIYLVPGLYASGSNHTDLITPWSELVAGGIVHVSQGTVYTNLDKDEYINHSSDALNGDLVIPSGGEITSIADDAFSCCDKLTSVVIQNGVTHIGYEAFAYIDMQSIRIADSVIYIEEDAFYYTEIENVYYDGTLEQWCQIHFVNVDSSPCFYSSLYLNGALITNVVLPENISSFSYAFAGCASLESIVIPNTITAISDYAFASCANLESVTLPATLTYIGKYAFDYCSSLTNISIPDNVTNIDSGAFSSAAFTTITIPDGVTRIENSTFANCRDLTTVTLPAGITQIGNRAFFYCENLEKIIFTGTVEQWSEVVIMYEWNDYANDFTVECANGTIAEGNFLSPPSISINGNVLTIPAVTNAQSYRVYVDGEFKADTSDLTFDLSTLGLSTGSYRINVSARAIGYTSSVVAFNNSWADSIGRYVLYEAE